MRICSIRVRRNHLLTIGVSLLITACVLICFPLLLRIDVNKPLEIIEDRRLKVWKGANGKKYNVIASSERIGRYLDTRRRSRFSLNSTISALINVVEKHLDAADKTVQYPERIRTSSLSTERLLSNSNVKTFLFWKQNKITACDGNLELFRDSSGRFVSFHAVIFDKKLIWSKNVGGEEMSKIMKQPENSEYYKVNEGFFKLVCRNSPFPQQLVLSAHKGHLNKWLENTTPITADKNVTATNYVKDFTVIIQRYEYVNLYHTMTDFYNAFLVMKFFEKTPHKTNILLFDTHPKGSLDSAWGTIFNSSSRVSQLRGTTRYRHAVWNIPGYDSPMFDHSNQERIPLIEEFRTFFLKQHGVFGNSVLDCRERLRLVIIWRRDYVAHPRNPSGKIERKFANEKQLLGVANATGFFASVIGIQLDKMSMKVQLSIVSNADILVGMHGAGLTHTLFLPRHAGLIEFFPLYFPKLDHFKGLARWRGIRYLRWSNHDANNEMSEKRTRVPLSEFRQILFKMKQKICTPALK